MKLTLETLHLYADHVGECLIWSQSVGSHGYPQARLDGRTQLVRPYVYYKLLGHEFRRAYPRIVSRCGNPLCISPDCLRSWSASQIMVREYATGSRSTHSEYLSRLRRSIRTGQAKLTREQVAEIRALPASMTHTEIARTYGVHNKTISDLRRGMSWRTEFPASSVFAYAGAAR